jgi:uncharacterized protein (TIGR03437 family)
VRQFERPIAGVLLATALLAACEEFDPTAPFPGSLAIEAVAGDRQHAAPGTEVADELRVRVTHFETGDAVEGITIDWEITGGNGAALVSPSSSTDAQGFATARVRLGQSNGSYELEAGFPGMRSDPARFTLFAVAAATIASIYPAVAEAGDTVRIEGAGFASRPDDQMVLFDGLAATVTRASRTSLFVVVPPCLSTHTAHVVVQLGSLPSNTASLDVVGRPANLLQIDPGHAEDLSGADVSGCVSLSTRSSEAYLLVAYNTSQQDGDALPFQLTGAMAGANVTGAELAAPSASTQQGPVALRWESRLRAQERDLIKRVQRRRPAASPPLAARVQPPTVGQERYFNVFTWEGLPRRVRATARAVSPRAAVYEDVASPERLSDAELTALASTFDGPVYGTTTSLLGAASDVDENQRIVVLLTPAVNLLTDPDETGFIAGFTSFCDLLITEECATSNGAEVLYSIVPDSAGSFGRPHNKSDVLARLPGVLAHELAHLIHFHQRMLVRQATALEALWLSEAIAHTVEDTVGRVLRARGDATADRILRANYSRAALYLADPSRFALAYPEGYDSLEGRGAGWLFLTYLTGRFGPGLLKQLIETTDQGTSNFTARVRESWENLVGDWFLALFADDAPGLAGIQIDPRYSFPNLNLRRELASVTRDSSFPLRPTAAVASFQVSGTLAPSAASYVLLNPGTAGVALRLSGRRGAALAPGCRAHLRVWRLR